ncbi:MAG TPA: TraR/DksA C4-type zinc finger protein [Candidatus Woesebacteria bacterium]|nr:TraR/DksA C4-type zinc finger protein [Candidatus Woesebacteria bacterium]HRT40175.1 TraR/DksA C4-type zinc finger protein [Candidatus Woesebacteria bacterium]
MNNNELNLPKKLLEPIRLFLEREIVRLKRAEKKLKKADPFKDNQRTNDNSLEEDVDEQIGHFDKQVKVKFLNRQIVQLRKALTMIKLGKYGICEKCGKMIDTDRLAVKPDTTLCIKCEREQEK